MRKISLLFLLTGVSLLMLAQERTHQNKTTSPQSSLNSPPEKKYSSLLWEITGRGLTRPSYLFGTMHVSDKLAFHLGDSFYNALKSVQMVALETNPDYWQDDYSNSSFFGRGARQFSNAGSNIDSKHKLTITSFSFGDYKDAIKAALAVEPSLVNGLLYRTYGTNIDDFEEDTYLDMYIFQAGKKLGKRLTGVENFTESEKIVKEAYRDMYRDRNRKRRSFDFESRITNPKKLEDAYRNGDLDEMDSLQSLDVTSEAFEEKFLYKRNEIQAHSIDTILKKSSLFVAVGAAHLPGKRGVIELLRRMGYTLRPVKMDDRNSTQKEQIDHVRYATNFKNSTSDDGFYQVSIPGKKFYRFTDWSGMDVVQYADMVNGAYYMVTRVKTNSFFIGDDADLVHRRIDSFMYENVPGKLLRKTAIVKNGYNGWDILNRTRRGDYQRYQVFNTPFEVVVFKISGNGDYVTRGPEANQFFNSIKLKEYKQGNWFQFSPSTGGFSVLLPHQPSVLKDENYGANRMEYGAIDNAGNSFIVMQSSIHSYSFIEEDSFELHLMDDSYAYSSFIDQLLHQGFSMQDGYPALESKYLHKDGSFSKIKSIIRGPQHYLLVAHFSKGEAEADRFLNSFSLKPYIYPPAKQWADTAMRYTVLSPVFNDTVKKEDDMSSFLSYAMTDDDEWAGFQDRYKLSNIGNDTIGEKILVTYSKMGDYSYLKDTLALWKTFADEEDDTSFIVRLNKKYDLAGGVKCWEQQFSDTGSSRLIWIKSFYKDGYLFRLTTLTDTFAKHSPFLQSFFTSFHPADTIKGASVFQKKTTQFFSDFFSPDSSVSKKARRSMSEIEFDSLDIPLIEMAIGRLNWNMKNYLSLKKYLISSLSDLKDPSIIPFLRNLYMQVKDTSELQNAILQSLLEHKTKESFEAFRDLLIQEPPISDDGYDNDLEIPVTTRMVRLMGDFGDYSNIRVTHDRWEPLYDTLSLTSQIFPGLLPLMNVEDYETDLMALLTTLVDSGYVKGTVYESQFSKLYLDTKQMLKKQIASEEQNNIEKLQKKDRAISFYYDDEDEDRVLDEGNDNLTQHAVLLLPFYDKNPGVSSLFSQMLQTKDRRLLYDVFILLLRNKKPVPDSLLSQYAKLDEYRAALYNDLKKMNRLELFPKEYLTQEQMARSTFLSDKSQYEKPDTLIYLDRLSVTDKGRKGWVYFFKYKEARDDNFWQIASVGMQPEKEGEINNDNDDFNDAGNYKLDNNKPVREQLQKMLKELMNARRASAASYYDSKKYSIYRSYLPDMVKSQRYRD